MKVKDIKRHLQSYSIYGKRQTTINHAFASALAICDPYSEEKVKQALLILGMNPEDDLDCFYCDDKKAETWDHVVNLVKDGKFQGYGHQIGNLVPSCKDCNSAKGKKDWKEFLESQFKEERLKEKKRKLKEYIDNNVVNTLDILEEFDGDLEEYYKIKEEIFLLMREADKVADRVREKVAKKRLHSS